MKKRSDGDGVDTLIRGAAARYFLLFFLAAGAVAAQPSGQVSGVIQVDAGAALAGAVVTATHVFSPSGAPLQKPAYTISKAEGSFVFGGLAAGTYRFCVQVTGSDVLDPCLWPSTSPSAIVNLAQGQQVAGFAITVKRGVPVYVRMDDPSSLMQTPQTPGKSTAILVSVAEPRGMMHHAAVVANDASGRTYRVVVPADSSLNLLVHSPNVQLNDAQGNPLAAQPAPTPFQVSHGSPAQLFRFSVQGMTP